MFLPPCPNTPRCAHTAALHDIWTPEDPRPTCCAEGCECGHDAARAAAAADTAAARGDV